MRRRTRSPLALLTALPLALPATALLAALPAALRAQTLRVTNNHDSPFRGPLRLAVDLADGSYATAGDAATADVRGGVARVVASIGAGRTVVLTRRGPARERPFAAGPFAVAPRPGGAIALSWGGRSFGTLDLGLAVVPGTTAGPDDATGAYRALDVAWAERGDGTLRGRATRDGYALDLTLTPYGGGWLDARARLSRAGAPAGSADSSGASRAYLALVRRLVTPGVSAPRVRFNGRVFDGAASPDTWDRDFWYVRGADWLSWTAGPLSLAAVNAFTPAPTIRRPDGAWAEGSHFWVWERTRRAADTLFLISEVAGPNAGQEKSRYMPVTPYAPLLPGDTVDLRWRLAVDTARSAGVAESQLGAVGGYRAARRAAPGVAVADLGVPHVTFGTSYFPYSTLAENFDFYRTAGLDRETFWAFSPTLWARWRDFRPRMRTDLHVARAMGFEMVRLHHLELLRAMPRAEAFAFLDWLTAEGRALGLRFLIDTEGPAEWVGALAARYGDVAPRFELENEVLIQGIHPGDAERWKALYAAAKGGAPKSEVFFTAAGNDAMFERLRALGVPFDRVGLHAYKHGPQWKEAYASHVLGTAGYASDVGKAVTLGEFNWKELTKLSPPARVPEVAALYESVLAPRAIPELFEFQFQESLSFNPAIAGGFTRHYEPLAADRRPKPEAFELMRLVRKYGPADAPANELPVAVREARLAPGREVEATFTVTNRTRRTLAVSLQALAFDGVASRLVGPATLTLRPGQSREGRVALRLADSVPLPGTYHHFVRASYASGGNGKFSLGWGVASNPGAPTFDAAPVLADRVRYPEGADVVRRVDWSRPLAVVFGEKASVIELESAYTLFNTLQSATGRPVWLSSAADLPDSLRRDGTVLVVGTPASNAMTAAPPASGTPTAAGADAAAQGVVTLRPGEGSGQWLLLSGPDRDAAEAAAMDVVLRFWKSAREATIRVSGLEKGAAFGNKAGVGAVELP